MKQIKKLTALMLVFTTLLAFFPTECFAAYKVKTLNLNQWYKLKDSSSNMTIYKVKVPEDSVYIVSWKKHDTDYFAYGTISTDKACNNNVDTFLGVSVPSSGSKGIVLYKGTYYIKMYDSKEKTQVKITSKTVQSINKENYSVSRATILAKNKKMEIAQTKRDHYTRWYRIKLTKSQTISIYGYDSWYDLYDSNFNPIRCNRDYQKKVITTDGVQSKGVYYLAVYDYVSSLLKSGAYYKLYWK